MPSTAEVSASVNPPQRHEEPTRRTLLSVLPMTTAWAGAGAVVLVPTAAVVGSAVFGRGGDGLLFLVVMMPPTIGGAAVAFVFGLAAGALAGLPDRGLRRRRPGVLGDGAAVAILTLVVAGAASAVCVRVPYLLPFPVPVQVLLVAAVTAVCTVVVVAVHRRRERRQRRARSAA